MDTQEAQTVLAEQLLPYRGEGYKALQRLLAAPDIFEIQGPSGSAYRLQIDFGPELGIRKSSAQLTARYRREELEGRRVLAVVNFPPRQIGPFMSEVLTLGVPDADGQVVLVVPDLDVPLGGKLF